MNKLIICLVAILCFVGCEQFKECKKTADNVSEICKSVQPTSHVKTLWKQNDIEFDEIDGHQYLVGRLNSKYYGSQGVCSIVHSPSCHRCNKLNK